MGVAFSGEVRLVVLARIVAVVLKIIVGVVFVVVVAVVVVVVVTFGRIDCSIASRARTPL